MANCLHCNEVIPVSDFDRGHKGSYEKRKYCGKPCWARHANILRFGGGRRIQNGYVRIRSSKGDKFEHRVIAERALGRELKDNEVVHHINCLKWDNRLTNLLICTRGYHKWLHDEMGRRYAQGRFDVPSGSLSPIINTRDG